MSKKRPQASFAGPVGPSLQDYELLEPIGKGSFALVHKAKKKSDGQFYALKKLSKEIDSNKMLLKLLNNEICILTYLPSHKNIIRLDAHFIENGTHHMVYEMCPLGNLNE